MGELLLVRHGETEWTLSRRHTGLTDLPLTANGEDQARALAPLLAGRAIGLALTSPLPRASRTAELAGLGYAQVEPNLHEWDYGGYEGLTTAEIRGRRPDWVLWTDGVAGGPEGHPGETRTRSAPAPTGSFRASPRSWPIPPGATWSWSRTGTFCGSSRPAASACRRPPAPCSASIPGQSAPSAPSMAGR